MNNKELAEQKKKSREIRKLKRKRPNKSEEEKREMEGKGGRRGGAALAALDRRPRSVGSTCSCRAGPSSSTHYSNPQLQAILPAHLRASERLGALRQTGKWRGRHSHGAPSLGPVPWPRSRPPRLGSNAHGAPSSWLSERHLRRPTSPPPKLVLVLKLSNNPSDTRTRYLPHGR